MVARKGHNSWRGGRAAYLTLFHFAAIRAYILRRLAGPISLPINEGAEDEVFYTEPYPE